MKSNNRKELILIVGIIITVILYSLLPQTPDSPPKPLSPSQLEKTGAGFTVDYIEASNRIHEAVDAALARERIAPKDVKEAGREVDRTAVEGQIRWHARKLLLVLSTDGKANDLEQSVLKLVKDAGGEEIGTEPDNYQGFSVVRYDFGIKDKLDNDPLTIVTDRLYIARDRGTSSPTAKPKPGGKRGELAIIIDDFGYTREPIGAFAEMGRPITFSVLSYRDYSNEAASKALANGHLVMLHLPLEPLSPNEEMEPTAITVGMSDEQIRQTVAKAIASVPGIKGVNNHQGSKATADKRVMKAVMAALKSQSLFFVDSRTSARSIAYDAARSAGLRTGENELFLDNSSDINYIKKQLRTAGDMAVRNGSAIVIGHARTNTAIAIREMIPELEANGVRLVYASQLLE